MDANKTSQFGFHALPALRLCVSAVQFGSTLPYSRLFAFICGCYFLFAPASAEEPARGLDPSAGYARTKLFGLEAQGAKFVYVFDRSGSMGELGGKPLREAKKELLSSLNDLDQRQQFYIDRKSTRLTPVTSASRMPSSA